MVAARAYQLHHLVLGRKLLVFIQLRDFMECNHSPHSVLEDEGLTFDLEVAHFFNALIARALNGYDSLTKESFFAK
jgi:hypothetical protein